MEDRYIIIRAFFLVIISSLFFSCDQIPANEDYYYTIYNNEDKIKGYIKREVRINDTIRLDSIFRYDKNKVLQNESNEYFTNYSDRVLESINKEDYYIVHKKDTCYNYISVFNDDFESCYLGKIDLEVNNIKFKEAYKFVVTKQVIDGISNYKIFDKDFILIRQEYKDGFLDYYRIDRVDFVDGI